MSKILEVSKFSAKYGSLRVLSDLSFSLQSHTCTGLIGPNGAGKTTLMKGLLGSVEATGQVRFNNILIRDGGILHTNMEEVRSDIGYLPEVSAFYKFLSPWEFLQMIGNLLEYDSERTKNKIKVLLDYFNLTNWSDRLIQELSKGNLQRLSLAVTFMQEPKLLLLDEPLGGLAPGGRRALLDIIKEYKSTGIERLGITEPGSVLLSSHILGDLEEICDNYLLMDKSGDIIWTGNEQDLSEYPDISTIEDLYLSKIKEN